MFANIGSDNSIWGPLVEKVFAKMNGNYENLGYGWPSEAFNLLTNVPVATYKIDKLSSKAVFDIANNADNEN